MEEKIEIKREWEARKWEGSGYKVGTKNKKKEETEAPEKQTKGLELRGDAWWLAMVRLVGEHSSPILVCPVAALLYICVHQGPP